VWDSITNDGSIKQTYTVMLKADIIMMEDLTDIRNLGDTKVNGTIILKFILKKQLVHEELNSIELAQWWGEDGHISGFIMRHFSIS
jgi:hypothetical protein